MLPKNINDLFHYSDFIGNVAFVMFGVLPIVLLGIAKVRGGKT